MRGGEKMRRFLKKLSLLCLTLVLCASTFLGLSANAALEDIDDCYFTEGSAAWENVYNHYFTEGSAALKVIRFNGLSAKRIRTLVNNVNEDRYEKMYICREFSFASLLREMGQDEMADAYEEYRQSYLEDLLKSENRAFILENIDDIVCRKTEEFFIKFIPPASNIPAAALYALIHKMSFEEAMEILA